MTNKFKCDNFDDEMATCKINKRVDVRCFCNTVAVFKESERKCKISSAI